ncbi:MAG: hypothetical protein ABI831_18435 [Betaproteobacteria bacterium]
MSNDQDTLRDEYPEDLIRSGARGKYTKAYREGTNIVLIDPDLHEMFPTSEAVNRALRDYIASKLSAA